MGETPGDFPVWGMYDRGVRRVFGCSGDGINGAMGALQRFYGKDGRTKFFRARWCGPNTPHSTFEQAKGFLVPIFRGDPGTAGIVKRTAKDVVAMLLSRDRS